MKRSILAVALAASLSFAASGVQYEIPRSKVDVRVIELAGHKYVVGAIVGEFCEDYKATGGSGSALSLCHFEGCKCKSTNTVANAKSEQGPRLFSKKMRLQKYEEQKGICPHCTNHFEFSEMEGDHVIPYSKGGKTEYSNLQMLCRPCNRKKSNKYSY